MGGVASVMNYESVSGWPNPLLVITSIYLKQFLVRASLDVA